jgi:large subunit ribosomal protein L29
MAKKEKINYAELTAEELRVKLAETRDQLFQLKFQSATAPLKNPHAITTARREIARLSTFLRQKGVPA